MGRTFQWEFCGGQAALRKENRRAHIRQNRLASKTINLHNTIRLYTSDSFAGHEESNDTHTFLTAGLVSHWPRNSMRGLGNPKNLKTVFNGFFPLGEGEFNGAQSSVFSVMSLCKDHSFWLWRGEIEERLTPMRKLLNGPPPKSQNEFRGKIPSSPA